MNPILEQMIAVNADGVDFHPIMEKSKIGTHEMRIYESHTREEFANVNSYPRSCYVFWKIVDGQKQYIKD